MGLDNPSSVSGNTISMPSGDNVFGIVVRDTAVGAQMTVADNQIDTTGSTGTGIYLYDNPDPNNPVLVQDNTVSSNVATAAIGIAVSDSGSPFGDSTLAGDYATLTGNATSGLATGIFVASPNGQSVFATIADSANNTSGTDIEGGTLQVSDSTGLGTGGLVVNGGKLDLNGNSITVGTLSGSGGTITDQSSTGGTTILTVDQASDATYAGVIADGQNGALLSLTKSGSGTLMLAGSCTYTGSTTVQGGALMVAPTDINLAPDIVYSPSPIGTVVGTLSTTDPSSTDTNFTYSLVPGDGSTDNSSFLIVGDQVEVNTTVSQAYYSIRVRSTDSAGMWFEKVITIVNPLTTTTTVSASTTSQTYGGSVTFTAFVTAGIARPDSGTVYFYDNGSTSSFGHADVNSGADNGAEGGIATLTVSSLALGTNVVTAYYGGSDPSSSGTQFGPSWSSSSSGLVTTTIAGGGTEGVGNPATDDILVPTGVAADSTGDLYLDNTNTYTEPQQLRQVTALNTGGEYPDNAGYIYTVLDTGGVNPNLNDPTGLAVGNLYPAPAVDSHKHAVVFIANTGNNCIIERYYDDTACPVDDLEGTYQWRGPVAPHGRGGGLHRRPLRRRHWQ